MQWTDFAAYKANVDGAVTAVAEMDGTWFAFTYNAIWSISGPGPNDNGADGSFNAPQRLPSNIGCISHKSLVLTGDGLIFQGAADRLFILPRGSSAPAPIGWPVRDTLSAYPFISAAAFDQTSNVAYWACVATDGLSGRLLVFDTRLQQWYVDNPCNGRAIKALSIYDGRLVIDGSIMETAGTFADNDGSVSTTVVPSVATGDLRPFGLTGSGRCRKVQILGEARDVTTAFTPTLEVSYDSGKTWPESVSWPISSLASAVGDAIDGAEHLIKYPRGDTFRLRFSWSTPTPTEGVVWHGVSLEAYPERGLKRLPNSRRT